MLNANKSLFLKNYWGDFVIYPFILIYSLYIAYILKFDKFFEVLDKFLIGASAAIAVIMLLVALYQFFIHKKHQLRDIFYIVAALLLLFISIEYIQTVYIRTYSIALKYVIFAVRLVASNVATARLFIWLYRRYKAKKARASERKKEEADDQSS